MELRLGLVSTTALIPPIDPGLVGRSKLNVRVRVRARVRVRVSARVGFKVGIRVRVRVSVRIKVTSTTALITPIDPRLMLTG